MKRLVSIYVFALVGLGCAKLKSPSVDASEAPEVSVLAAATCRFLARCHSSALNAFSGGTLAACEAHFTCGGGGLSALVALASESTRDASACAAELAAARCDEVGVGSSGDAPRLIPPPGSACGDTAARDTELPKLGLGERCLNGENVCSSGLACKFDMPIRTVAGSLCGVCTAMPEPDQACVFGVPCAGLSFCDEGRCVAAHEHGAPCSTGNECLERICEDGTCALNAYLHLVSDAAREGTSCAGETLQPCAGDVTLACIDGTCVRRRGVGERCTLQTDCRGGLLCAAGSCKTSQACTTRVNAPCGPGAAFRCAGDTVCVADSSTSMHCVPRIIGHEAGDACNAFCDVPNLSCRDSVCVENKPELGTRCDNAFDCGLAACERDVAAYCSATESGFGCNIPSCDKCGTCVQKPTPSACGAPP